MVQSGFIRTFLSRYIGSEATRRGDVPARYRRTCDKPTMEVTGGNGWRGSEKFTVTQLLSMCGFAGGNI